MTIRLSNEIEQKILGYVLRDLDPSWILTHSKVAFAAISGGLLSLFVCGQFGYGFTSLANSFNHTLHSHMGTLPCAVICGLMYAVFPMVILRFILCPPLQFKAIMKRRWQAILIWFGGFGGVMASMGHHGTDILALSLWIIGALVAANILAHIMYVISPVQDFRLQLKILN